MSRMEEMGRYGQLLAHLDTRMELIVTSVLNQLILPIYFKKHVHSALIWQMKKVVIIYGKKVVYLTLLQTATMNANQAIPQSLTIQTAATHMIFSSKQLVVKQYSF